MVGTGSNNGDGKDFDAMVKKAGAENLREGVFISREGKVTAEYKDLDSALSAYVAEVKKAMEGKTGGTKPTLVVNNFGDDTPSRTV